MVRLVFRPYTQVRRTICTSVSLRASTRVSPGFTLLRHSSPSFGSQRSCSCASSTLGTMGPIVHGTPEGADPTSGVRDPLRFRYAQWFATRALAWTLDSLVRVSRRVGSDHFVSAPNTHMGHNTVRPTQQTQQCLHWRAVAGQGERHQCPEGRVF